MPVRIPPTVLTVGGSDSSGATGLPADVRAIAASGAHAAPVVSAVKARGGRSVQSSWSLPPEIVRDQIEAVFSDLEVRAAKTGMLAEEATVTTVASALRRWRPAAIVVDPVMASRSGYPLLAAAGVDALRGALLPLATVITPNVVEAQTLTGIEIRGLADAEAAGRALLETGCRAVLVTGGGLHGAPATDLLVTPEGSRAFRGERLDPRHSEGAGSTLSAAIAAHLARGADLPLAVARAKALVTEALRRGFAPAGGEGQVDALWAVRAGNDGE